MTIGPGTMVTPHVRLERTLGEGGMGRVWVAEHLNLEMPVAVKFIAEELADDDPEVLARFQREAKAAAKIRSPHVVQTFDTGVMDDGTPYIVMELLEGSSLMEWLELTMVLSVAEAVSMVDQVAKGLAKAHLMGIVHRDIKPANIFLCDDERERVDELVVKVLDFGIAKRASMPERDGLTQPGMMMGTPEYMCPEQLTGEVEVNELADLWGLSVVAYEALTGELPFDGKTVGAVCARVLQQKFGPPTKLRPSLGPGIDAWFVKAFHEDYEQRHQSVTELSQSFRRALAATQSKPSSHATPSSDRAAAAADAPPADAPPAVPTPTPSPAAPSASPSPSPASVEPTGAELHREEPAPDEAPESQKGTGRRFALVFGIIAVVALGWLLVRPDAPADTDSPPSPIPSAPIAKNDGPVAVPVGYFVMGCEPGRDAECDEPPTKKVLAGFYIDRTEVTVAEYSACTAADACDVEHLQGDVLESYDALKCNWNRSGRERHPINCVSWKQADAYCRWSGGTLPTAAQWEKAARGSKARIYPWGSSEPSCTLAVMNDGSGEGCGRQQTWRVGSRPSGASAAGALDMAGNVGEWTATEAGGTGKSVMRTVRGGGLKSDAKALQSWRDESVLATATRADLGFRCVRTEF